MDVDIKNLKTSQDILQEEHEVKMARRERLNRYQQEPNLLWFYKTIILHLEALFLSNKAVMGGAVKPEEGGLSNASAALEFIEDLGSIVPVIGNAIKALLKWTVEKKLDKYILTEG